MNKKDWTTDILYVSCLPKFVTERSLHQYFGTFGSISKVEILTSLENSPHQYAVVHGNSSKALTKICHSKTHEINSKKMKVKRLPSKDHIAGYVEKMRRCRVYVRNFPNNLNEEDLYQIFIKFGNLNEYFIRISKRKNKIKKSAFIVFEEESSINNLPPEGMVHKKELIVWSCFFGKANPRLNPETQKIFEKLINKGNWNKKASFKRPVPEGNSEGDEGGKFIPKNGLELGGRGNRIDGGLGEKGKKGFIESSEYELKNKDKIRVGERKGFSLRKKKLMGKTAVEKNSSKGEYMKKIDSGETQISDFRKKNSVYSVKAINSIVKENEKKAEIEKLKNDQVEERKEHFEKKALFVFNLKEMMKNEEDGEPKESPSNIHLIRPTSGEYHRIRGGLIHKTWRARFNKSRQKKLTLVGKVENCCFSGSLSFYQQNCSCFFCDQDR